MSVINQMLRELDARNAAAADLHAMPAPMVKGKPRRAVPIWGGLGLLAAGAGIYWMLSAMPERADEPAAPVITREKARIIPVDVEPVMQPVPQPPIITSSLEPSIVAPDTPQTRMPVPEAGLALQVQMRSSAHKPLIPVRPVVSVAAQRKPAVVAVVKKLTELSPEAEAQQYYDDAQTLHRLGKFEAAMAGYRQALDHNAGMANARIGLAELLQKSGQTDVALALLKAGFGQHADDRLAIAAGRLLADLGQGEEALGWLARGQGGLRPEDHALMGALLSQVRRHQEAARAYQRALTSDPNQGGWLLGLGLAMEAQGRVEEARTVYRNALERGQFKPEVVQFLRERSGIASP